MIRLRNTTITIVLMIFISSNFVFAYGPDPMELRESSELGLFDVLIGLVLLIVFYGILNAISGTIFEKLSVWGIAAVVLFFGGFLIKAGYELSSNSIGGSILFYIFGGAIVIQAIKMMLDK